MTDRDRVLQERLGALVGGGKEDWKDVRRRARAHGYRRPYRTWIWLALATAAVAVAAGPPVVIGRSVLDLFRDPEKPALPRTFLNPHMRLSLDRRYGEWSIHEVATDGRTAFYSIRNGNGEVVCVAHGRADWQTAGWPSPFGGMKCGDPGGLLSDARPLYYEVIVEDSIERPGPRPWRVTGVAADGVAKVAVIAAGDRMEFDVEDHAFTITTFPYAKGEAIRIAALDGDGEVISSEYRWVRPGARLAADRPTPAAGSA